MSVVRIAERAGVSIATVSRVLNNSRPVNPDIAEQVRRAMAELNFSPREFRRRARQRQDEKAVRTLAIVTVGQSARGWFEMPVMASVVGKVTQVANEQHLGMLIAEMPDPTQLSPTLSRQRVDGALLFIGSNLTTKVAATIRQQMPVVRVMGGEFGPAEIDHVASDHSAVGYLAGEHLLREGCRSLAFLTVRPDWDLSRLRAQGFAAAAAAARSAPRLFVVGDLSEHEAFFGRRDSVGAPDLRQLVARVADHVRETAARGAGPVGLFVSRDEEVVPVYAELAAAGVRPGRDVTVVSCDNEEVRLSTLRPRPVSVDLDAEAFARQAIDRLLWRIGHPDDPPVRLLVSPKMPAIPTAAGTSAATTARPATQAVVS